MHSQIVAHLQIYSGMFAALRFSGRGALLAIILTNYITDPEKTIEERNEALYVALELLQERTTHPR